MEWSSKRVRRVGAVTAALALTMLVGGCGAGARSQAAESGAEKETVVMPDYSMAVVEDAGVELADMGLKVVVVRPAFTVECGEKTTKPGTSFGVEEYRKAFAKGEWDHWVTAQDPAPDAEVAVGSTVTLTAGEHQGAAPGKKWLEAHGEVTKREGDKDCLKSCHKKKHCTDCHDKAGVKDDKAPKS